MLSRLMGSWCTPRPEGRGGKHQASGPSAGECDDRPPGSRLTAFLSRTQGIAWQAQQMSALPTVLPSPSLALPFPVHFSVGCRVLELPGPLPGTQHTAYQSWAALPPAQAPLSWERQVPWAWEFTCGWRAAGMSQHTGQLWLWVGRGADR